MRKVLAIKVDAFMDKFNGKNSTYYKVELNGRLFTIPQSFVMDGNGCCIEIPEINMQYLQEV